MTPGKKTRPETKNLVSGSLQSVAVFAVLCSGELSIKFLKMKKIEEKKLVKTFLDLVKIDSPTGDVGRMQNKLMKIFRELGFVCKKDKHGNLIFRTKKFDAKKSLLLTTHIDTVEPGRNIKPKVKNGFVTSSGKTILGADPKSGIAALVFVLQKFQREGRKISDLEIIFSTNEEEGDHTLSFAKIASKKALVLDNAGDTKEIVTRGPFAKVFEVEVLGKEVYAQINYPRGANAVVALAEIISGCKWGFFKKGCVANTGVVFGGRSTTVVPGRATLKGNVYCLAKKDLESYVEKLKKICVKVDDRFGTKTKVRIVEEYSNSEIDMKGEFVKEIESVYNEKGVRPRFVDDLLLISSNNCLFEKGIQSLNLGQGYSDCHTTKEKLSVNQFVKFAEILEGVVEWSCCSEQERK